MKHPNDDIIYKLTFLSLSILCNVCMVCYGINRSISLFILAQFLFALLLNNLVQHKTIKDLKKYSKQIVKEKQNTINESKIMFDIIDREFR